MQYPIIDRIASAYINNGWTGLNIPSSVTFTYIQEGEGTPSTENVRDIHPGAVLNIGGEIIDVYDGTIDLQNRTLTINKKGITYDGSEEWNKINFSSARAYGMSVPRQDIKNAPTQICVISNYLEGIENDATWGDHDEFCVSHKDGGNYFIVCGIRSITTKEGWTDYLTSHPLTCVYDLPIPEVIQLTYNDVLDFIISYQMYDIPYKLKLPIMKCRPLLDALISAAAGTQTADDTEILRHYLTPLGIGGI